MVPISTMVLVTNRVPSSEPMIPTPGSKPQHKALGNYRSPTSKPIIASFTTITTHNTWINAYIITITQEHKWYHIEPHNCMYNINKIVSHWNHKSQPTCHQNTIIKQSVIILAIYHINLSTTETQCLAKRFTTPSWKTQQQYTYNPNLIILNFTTTV